MIKNAIQIQFQRIFLESFNFLNHLLGVSSVRQFSKTSHTVIFTQSICLRICDSIHVILSSMRDHSNFVQSPQQALKTSFRILSEQLHIKSVFLLFHQFSRTPRSTVPVITTEKSRGHGSRIFSSLSNEQINVYINFLLQYAIHNTIFDQKTSYYCGLLQTILILFITARSVFMSAQCKTCFTADCCCKTRQQNFTAVYCMSAYCKFYC